MFSVISLCFEPLAMTSLLVVRLVITKCKLHSRLRMNKCGIKNWHSTITLFDQHWNFCTAKNNAFSPFFYELIDDLENSGFGFGPKNIFSQFIINRVINQFPLEMIGNNHMHLVFKKFCWKKICLHGIFCSQECYALQALFMNHETCFC